MQLDDLVKANIPDLSEDDWVDIYMDLEAVFGQLSKAKLEHIGETFQKAGLKAGMKWIDDTPYLSINLPDGRELAIYADHVITLLVDGELMKRDLDLFADGKDD
ncbi:MAG: hypothetical protein HUJ27_15440 [Rhodobacteraceae bacterium]|nr:hypothetical protein [Paracoccaceae bacterium]